MASRRTASFESLSRRCLTGSVCASISNAGTEVALNAPVISLVARARIVCRDEI